LKEPPAEHTGKVIVPAAVLILPEAVGIPTGGLAKGNSEMFRIEDVGKLPPDGQGVPQFVAVGHLMKILAGTLKLVDVAG
jgi:hypothetical protein